MSDEELIAVAKSDPDAQPTDAKFWEDAWLVMPGRKISVIDRDVVIDQKNVGRIAERIVSNELEARGFRVSDLNREGLAANADLLAAGHQHVWQIQVKGAANKSDERWWVQYGFCTGEIIDRKGPMFNRRSSFYRADIVVLVAVRSPREYRCVVLPIEAAEWAAQKNLDREYRTPTRKGARKNRSRYGSTLNRQHQPRANPLPCAMKNPRYSKSTRTKMAGTCYWITASAFSIPDPIWHNTPRCSVTELTRRNKV